MPPKLTSVIPFTSREDILTGNQTIGSISFDRQCNPQVLGAGSYGAVYLRIADIEGKRQEVAYKILNNHNDLSTSAQIELEVSILSRLEHPHVGGLIGATLSENQMNGFVLPYISGKNLDKEISLMSKNLSSQVYRAHYQKILNVAPEHLAAGLAYIHNSGIIHFDLKPSNIMVTPVNGQPHLVIIDFSLAEDFGLDEGYLSEPKEMTVGYAPPEILAKQRYNNAVDMYSLGIVLYELFAHDFFYSGWQFYSADRNSAYNPDKIKAHVLSGQRPAPALKDERVWGLVQKLWEANPRQRLTSSQLVELLSGPISGRVAGVVAEWPELAAYRKKEEELRQEEENHEPTHRAVMYKRDIQRSFPPFKSMHRNPWKTAELVLLSLAIIGIACSPVGPAVAGFLLGASFIYAAVAGALLFATTLIMHKLDQCVQSTQHVEPVVDAIATTEKIEPSLADENMGVIGIGTSTVMFQLNATLAPKQPEEYTTVAIKASIDHAPSLCHQEQTEQSKIPAAAISFSM